VSVNDHCNKCGSLPCRCLRHGPELTAEEYRHLSRSFDDGDGLHPNVATQDYGFPILVTPGTQLWVPPVPDDIGDELPSHEVLIFQAARYANGNLAWRRLRSYARWRRGDAGLPLDTEGF
jgi:hypothetical protein